MKFLIGKNQTRHNLLRILSAGLITPLIFLPTSQVAFAVCPGTTAPSFLPNGDVNPELMAQIDAYVACTQAENAAR